MSARSTPLRVGSIAAFVAAGAAIAAAVAGGVTEPTGIAAAAAIVAVVLAYGIAPLVVSIALRLSALASWWAVAAGVLAAVLWATAAMLLAVPALHADALAIVGSVSISSALWIIVASLEVVRVGVERWSLVILAAFVAVLMIGSLFIEQGAFDVTMVAVPLGWAAWMIDLGRGLRLLMNPRPANVDTTVVAPCANCGAPRRRDGLAFCPECGLPYAASPRGD